MRTVMSAGSAIFCYDANGNRSQKIDSSATSYTYDAENRMTAVSGAATATFVYDGDGNRVKGVVGGVTTTYIGNYFEWTGSTSTMKKYYYAGGTRVAERVGSGTTYYFLLTDHLGSTSITATRLGAFSSELRYKAWGETRYSSGSTPTTFRYTGQREESSLGLYWYASRWYSPGLSRFVSPDTIIPQPGNPQAWDRYSYTSNNPVNYIDPTGHAQACADGDEGGRCGRGSNTEEIYKTFDSEHGGMYDGLFAEYYAKLHQVTLAKARSDPNLSDYEASANVSYQYAAGWVPQYDFNPVDFIGPGYFYGITKAFIDIGNDLISSGVVLGFTLLPASKGAKGNYLSPYGYPTLDSSPGQGFEWRGSSSMPGSPEGSWYNPETKEYLRIDLNHHRTQYIDYRAPDGNEYWIWPDGSMTQK